MAQEHTAWQPRHGPTGRAILKLAWAAISVRLYTATSERERVRFHQIHEPSGERVRQQLVVPGIGPVERDDIVKGFEYEKGRYVTVDPEDLKRLRLETTDTIDIVENSSRSWSIRCISTRPITWCPTAMSPKKATG